MTGVGWIIQENFRRSINIYTMHSTLHRIQEMMVNIIGVDALMKNDMLNLTSLRGVIINHP